MSTENQSLRPRFAQAFQDANHVINARQVEALHALMTTGELKGTNYDAVEPPTGVAIAPGGPLLEDLPPTPLHDANVEVIHSAHTCIVIAEDGRAWTIATAGITWPVQETLT